MGHTTTGGRGSPSRPGLDYRKDGYPYVPSHRGQEHLQNLQPRGKRGPGPGRGFPDGGPGGLCGHHRPVTSGQYLIDGQDVSNLSDDELSEIRNNEIGFIFQGFNLIPSLNALENVELPLIYRGMGREERHRLSTAALIRVGLEKRMDHRPAEMSGGQQQRVAIARAIAAAPPVILADEPTGNLDKKSGHDVMEILRGLWREGRTVILITHDPKIAESARRVVTISDGKIVGDITQAGQARQPRP